MRLVLIDREPIFGVGLARALALSAPAGRVWVHPSMDAWSSQHMRAPWPVDAVIIDASTVSARLPAALQQLRQQVPQAARVVAVRDASDLPEGLPSTVSTIQRTLSPECFVRSILGLVNSSGGQSGRPALSGAAGSAITPRQWEVLSLVARGESNKRIAAELCIAERTVKLHVTALMEHFGARNRIQILIKALELGLIEGSDGQQDRRPPPAAPWAGAEALALAVPMQPVSSPLIR